MPAAASARRYRPRAAGRRRGPRDRARARSGCARVPGGVRPRRRRHPRCRRRPSRALRTGVRIDGDDRDRRAGQRGRRCDDDGAVDEGAGQPGERSSLPPGLVRTGHQPGVGEQFVPGAGRRTRDAAEQLGRERFELGHEDPDDAGAGAPQAAGDQGGLVAELLDDLLHAEHRRGRHPVAQVDDLRHGRDRHPRGAGDVGDGHPAGTGTRSEGRVHLHTVPLRSSRAW